MGNATAGKKSTALARLAPKNARQAEDDSRVSKNPRCGPKVTIACSTCRRRKIKCNGHRPSCSFCAKSDLLCTYSAAEGLTQNQSLRRDNARLQAAHDRLQSTVSRLQHSHAHLALLLEALTSRPDCEAAGILARLRIGQSLPELVELVKIENGEMERRMGRARAGSGSGSGSVVGPGLGCGAGVGAETYEEDADASERILELELELEHEQDMPLPLNLDPRLGKGVPVSASASASAPSSKGSCPSLTGAESPDTDMDLDLGTVTTTTAPSTVTDGSGLTEETSGSVSGYTQRRGAGTKYYEVLEASRRQQSTI
ncbi:MAG: hypothetical protein LQ340_003141 [Diploschistes diacapsis]|nr:MAG: hypothetical protein LQ340_003141 [Diploschistes diacapsis]